MHQKPVAVLSDRNVWQVNVSEERPEWILMACPPKSKRLCHTLSARRTLQLKPLQYLWSSRRVFQSQENCKAIQNSRKLQNLAVNVIEWGSTKTLSEKNKENALDHNCACSTACPCIFPASIVEIVPSHNQRMMSTGGQKPVLDLDSTQIFREWEDLSVNMAWQFHLYLWILCISYQNQFTKGYICIQ